MVQQRFSNDDMNGNDFQKKTFYTIHSTTKFSDVYGDMKHLLGFTMAMI